jgi:hypothetical protein
MHQRFCAGHFEPTFVAALVNIFDQAYALWLSQCGEALGEIERNSLVKIIMASAGDGLDLEAIRDVARGALGLRTNV